MEEPRNAASDLVREMLPLWSDRAWIENEFPNMLTSDFVRHDRRSLISMPSANVDEYIAQRLDTSPKSNEAGPASIASLNPRQTTRPRSFGRR